MYNRAQLKTEVKQSMAATKPKAIWVTLLFLVILSVGSWLIQTVLGAVAGTSALTTQIATLMQSGYQPEEIMTEMMLMYADRLAALIGTVVLAALIGSVLSAVWQGLMGVGYDGYCLSMVKNEAPQLNRIFCGFSKAGQVILTAVLVWVFTMLWSLLYALGFMVIAVIAALLMESVPALSVILFVLDYIAIMILEVRLVLRYSMSTFVLLDTGKYGLDAISESKRMMKGNKGKLFVLYLSFIGWYLVEFAIVLVGTAIIAGLGAVGIGNAIGGGSYGAIGGAVAGIMVVALLMAVGSLFLNIWLQPYINGSVAKFYLFFRPQAPAPEEGWPTLAPGAEEEEPKSYDPEV
ncbi:MAG: DUF975 family protein [Oscillospiraceae bacterium]|nr:DUF975 family protein [Oscillospiraceae bacterium]